MGADVEVRTREVPAPPAIAGQPWRIGGVAIPSRFCLAPLAGFTSLAFRLSVRELGGLGLATTDLVNCRSLIEGNRRALELSATCPEDQPLSIQLYGSVIAEMRAAAQRAEGQGASLIDINMGCPVRKVVRTGGGSALLCQADAASRLAAAVVEAVTVPVTVKMRLGWDDQSLSAPSLARAFERVGVAAVIIHGRTRAQGFKGPVNRAGIRAVVEAVESIPVIGNGDLRTLRDVDGMFRETGCAAVSIGRGALGNPFLFRQLSRWAETGDPGPEPSFEERLAVMERHFRRLVAQRGPIYACLQFRKTLKWYYYFTKIPKPLYLQLVNLPDVATFDRVLARIREAGPTAALPGHFEPRVPVPSGPIDRW